KRRCSRFAPGPKTRKKEHLPFLRNVLRSSRDDSAPEKVQSSVNIELHPGSIFTTRRCYDRGKHFFWFESGRPGQLYRRSQRGDDPVRFRRGGHQSRAAQRGAVEKRP